MLASMMEEGRPVWYSNDVQESQSLASRGLTVYSGVANWEGVVSDILRRAAQTSDNSV
jgi:hypothetical protein